MLTVTNQRGYVVWALTVFALLIGVMIFPIRFPEGDSEGGLGVFCSDPPLGAQEISGPAYAITSSYQVDGEGNRGGFNDSILVGATTKYKMIKSSVPIINIGDDWFHFIREPKLTVDTTKGKRSFLWPTAISGAYSVQLPDNGGEPNVSFDSFGIVFLEHLNADGTPKSVMSGDLEIPIADVYKDVNKPELPYSDLFECTEYPLNEEFSNSYNVVVHPSQSPSEDRKELQLEWFLLDKSPFKAAVMRSGCKPAVYLYPQEKQLVNVKVHPKGFLTYVDPPYDESLGWTAMAFPTGRLEVQDSRLTIKNYEYLYYESKIFDQFIDKPEKGWVVRFEELEDLYNEILPRLGLNEKQTADFVEYWKKSLPEGSYYFVGIIDQANVDEFERLEIIPRPDSINRVRIYFEMLDSFKSVEAPVLSSGGLESDSGFEVVEWGGMVKLHPGTPFTCSQ